MELESVQYQFMITAMINGLIHLVILTTCIILVSKKRTPGTIFLLLGSILSFISFFGNIFYYIWAARQGTSVIDAQVVISYFQSFSFLVFGIGLLLLAINDFKKQ